jgi:hypothetical protein
MLVLENPAVILKINLEDIFIKKYELIWSFVYLETSRITVDIILSAKDSLIIFMDIRQLSRLVFSTVM